MTILNVAFLLKKSVKTILQLSVYAVQKRETSRTSPPKLNVSLAIARALKTLSSTEIFVAEDEGGNPRILIL